MNERIAHQLRKPGWIDLAGGRPAPAFIKTARMVAAIPKIEQTVGRAGVEALQRLAGNQSGQVGYAAKVDDRPRFIGGPKQGVVQQRRQRRALAAGGQVGTPKVGHGDQAGGAGNAMWITDLPSIGWLLIGLMEHGLAV